MKRMFAAYRKELEKEGHKEVWFPAVIPESFLKQEAKHAEFSAEVFWITAAGANKKKLEEPMCLRPTSETGMYNMYSRWIRSWRDLPFKRYQQCQVWRYESTTRPFLRGREFFWIEAHNCFATAKEAEDQIKEDVNTTEKVMHMQFGIPFIFFRRPAWDMFLGTEYSCAADTLTPDGRALQQPSTHFYGNKFAKAFNVKFKDQSGKEKYVYQTTYGPAIWRMIASIISLHGDNKGLILPFNLAPYQVVIIPIYKKDKNKEIASYGSKLASKLRKAGYRVFFDADEERSPGSKFYNWEIKGVPLRIEIGPRDLEKKQVVCMLRHTGKKQVVRVKDVVKHVKRVESTVLLSLRKQADALLKKNIHEAKTYAELEKKIKKGGFVKVNWCSIKEDGEPCAERIETDLLAKVRGIRIDKKEKPTGKCIVCGAKAQHIVYVAKQY
jgi:prolyl-tRNA synthetase